VTKRINTGIESYGQRDEAGIGLVVVALSMVVLLGFPALALDTSYFRTVKQRLQIASDAAAFAGASELSYREVTSAAKADAATNGFTDGVNGVTVTINPSMWRPSFPKTCRRCSANLRRQDGNR
jgi:uncharacterized membrane protein